LKSALRNEHGARTRSIICAPRIRLTTASLVPVTYADAAAMPTPTTTIATWFLMSIAASTKW
jgi:hypothetical protein